MKRKRTPVGGALEFSPHPTPAPGDAASGAHRTRESRSGKGVPHCSFSTLLRVELTTTLLIAAFVPYPLSEGTEKSHINDAWPPGAT